MTLKDLQNDVYALGFERVTDPDDLFISAANRALRMIYTECDIKSTVRLHTERAEVSSHIPKIRYRGCAMTLPLAGRAYSLRVSGKGRFVIRSATMVQIESFDTDDTLYRGFIDSTCTLTLDGEYSYTVYDLTTYAQIFSDRIEDIPSDSKSNRYDFSKYPDFLAFCDTVTDECGEQIRNISFEGSVLTVHNPDGRDVSVTYKKQPKRISGDEYEKIDVPPAAESALSLLCASFLWRDDEPEIAQHYFALGRELMSGVGEAPKSRSVKYKTTDGWA